MFFVVLVVFVVLVSVACWFLVSSTPQVNDKNEFISISLLSLFFFLLSLLPSHDKTNKQLASSTTISRPHYHPLVRIFNLFANTFHLYKQINQCISFVFL
jgi:hypothetical protein